MASPPPSVEPATGERALTAALVPAASARAAEQGLGQRIARATDAQLAWAISGALFLLAAWPLALVPLPPLQDLPNHLASATILLHPDRYPNFVFHGFFKTNSALFAWLFFVGRSLGLRVAARLYVLLVLALGAIALPRFVLAFAGRGRMVVASLFAWPMVHSWFVAMGMLDYATAVPLSALLLVVLNAQRERPTWARGAGAALLAVATWYAHVFPLLVVELLVLVQVVTRRGWRGRWTEAVTLVPPLAPSALLALWSVVAQWTDPVGKMTGDVDLGLEFEPVWQLVYNLWAEYWWTFSWMEWVTLVPCVLLGVRAARRWRSDAPFFGTVGWLVLVGAFVASPYHATNWFYFNSRFIAFVWMGALLRVPERLSPRWAAGLAACAVAGSLGMGVDYLRLGAEWSRFAAGEAAIPEGASLLPLVFRSKEKSENTHSLLHAWGLYALDRRTTAPLLFAHSRSFPVTYREPPPPQFNQLVLESFAPSMGDPRWLCRTLREGGVAVDDCAKTWREGWATFWRQAEPRFDHVLTWAAPQGALALIPPAYHLLFQRDELAIYGRARAEGARGSTELKASGGAAR